MSTADKQGRTREHVFKLRAWWTVDRVDQSTYGYGSMIFVCQMSVRDEAMPRPSLILFLAHWSCSTVPGPDVSAYLLPDIPATKFGRKLEMT